MLSLFVNWSFLSVSTLTEYQYEWIKKKEANYIKSIIKRIEPQIKLRSVPLSI
jgi:hypothetical protein